MSSATIIAHSPKHTFPTKKFHKAGYAQGSSPGNSSGSSWDRGPTQNRYHQLSKKAQKTKATKPSFIQKKISAKRTALLNRLSPQSPSGSLLHRIGGSIEDKADVDGEVEVVVADLYADLPDSVPHFYTPEPEEVERFLESVIGARAPSAPTTACSDKGTRPALAVETHTLPVEQPVKVEDLSSSVLYFPTETAVNSLLSGRTLEEGIPSSGDMTLPSASVLEECRKHLVPVLRASAKVRDDGSHLDSEQCARLLSDDRCTNFFRQARQTKHQISSLVSGRKGVYNGLNGNLKRNRVDETNAWSRNTRSRFDYMDNEVSESSWRDSEMTLVDFPVGRSLPKAPRAMLQASHSPSGRDTLVSCSRTGESSNLTPLIILGRDVIRMFPTLAFTAPPAGPTTEPCHSTITDVVVTGADPGDQFLPSVPSSPPSPTDFVSHLPTQPGIWFKQRGKKHPDVVEIDVDAGEDLFGEGDGNRSGGIKIGLRLCSFPAGIGINSVDPRTPLENIEAAIQNDAPHWPRKGTLVIQLNPDSQRGKTWLPYELESKPLDVTSYILPGKNTFRFIHLSDSSDFTFILVASPLPPEEEWRDWDWSSLFRRERMTPPSGDNSKRKSILMEFAQLPVIVQS